MNAALEMALAKACDSKDARALLGPGKHRVVGTVQVDGELTVGEDQMIAATASVLSVDTLIAILHYAGCTREHAVEAVAKVAREYLADWNGSEADKKAAKKARKAQATALDPDGKVQAIFEGIKESLPKVPRKGSVRFEGEVREVVVAELTTAKVA